MISATLVPRATSPDIALAVYHTTLMLARRERAQALMRARHRALILSRRTHELGHRSGYEQGRLEGKREFLSLLKSLRAHYEAAAERAHEDVLTIAHHILEQIINSYIEEHPEQLRSWISRAITGLRSASTMTLYYHPRYHHLIGSFISEFQAHLRVSEDPGLGDYDFRITTNAGDLTFSWRDMLRPLASTRLDIER